MTNKELISACQDLDRKAQREMMNRLAPPLYLLCLRYLKNEEDAKDVMQESLIQIFNKMNQFNGTEDQFQYWCNRIAINKALSKYRKASYQREIPITEHLERQERIAPSAIQQLQIEDILQLLKKLPLMMRHVFNLYILDGYKHREIAEILEIKESSSRTYLVRARELMQTLITESETYINNET